MLGRIYKTTVVPSHGVALQNGNPSVQVGIEGTYGHVLGNKLILFDFDLRLTSVANGVSSLYGGYMSIA